MTGILYLYSMKIDGGGGLQILSCKDSEIIAEKAFNQHIDSLNHLLSSLNMPDNILRPFPGVCIGRGIGLIYAALMDTVDSINHGQSMPTSSFI